MEVDRQVRRVQEEAACHFTKARAETDQAGMAWSRVDPHLLISGLHLIMAMETAGVANGKVMWSCDITL